MRLSMSQPRMKIERCALVSAERTAPKYCSPSTRNASRSARSMRQQLWPGTSNGPSARVARGRSSPKLAEMAQGSVSTSSRADAKRPNPIVGETARQTLNTFSDDVLKQVAASPQTPRSVLNYYLVPKTRRTALLASLVENPAVSDETLTVLADTASHDLIPVMINSPRVQKSASILMSLATNRGLATEDVQHIQGHLADLGADANTAIVYDHEADLWALEHEAEIMAEEGKAFELVGAAEEEREKAEEAQKHPLTEEQKQAEGQRLSTLQKLAKLSVGERVKAAMKGSKDERYILIRDGSKVVSSAVLASPKISDQEIETFAAMKNVQESVLRDIARNRKFIKNYNVVRNLVNNPRCPLDISLTLVKTLQVYDLKGLRHNKNVPDTIRKVAAKLYQDKAARGGAKKE